MIRILLFALVVCIASAKDFTGPDAWQSVNTNAINAWQAAQRKNASATVHVWKGVSSDTQRKEVRLLVEAVGHPEGTVTEFLVVGPDSHHAYESATIAVAKPSDIVRAIESIGIPRGQGVQSRPFRFRPKGERVATTLRGLGAADGAEQPLHAVVKDSAKEDVPLFGPEGLVFVGGQRDEAHACLADSQQPSAIISLYNEAGALFDLPRQALQSTVYGRLSLSRKLPYGALYEIVLRPSWPPDGQPRVREFALRAQRTDQVIQIVSSNLTERTVQIGTLAETLTTLKRASEKGRDLFVTLDLEDDLLLSEAMTVAHVFCMLDDKGIILDGRSETGLYPKAFLPQEKWRNREGRIPQPFELYVSRKPDGTCSRKLTFIEEDWSGEGLDPKLTPKEYPFADWQELPDLIRNAGGTDNKVEMLFVFAPADLPLSSFMPGVRSLAKRLPLVYVFPTKE